MRYELNAAERAQVLDLTNKCVEIFATTDNGQITISAIGSLMKIGIGKIEDRFQRKSVIDQFMALLVTLEKQGMN